MIGNRAYRVTITPVTGGIGQEIDILALSATAAISRVESLLTDNTIYEVSASEIIDMERCSLCERDFNREGIDP